MTNANDGGEIEVLRGLLNDAHARTERAIRTIVEANKTCDMLLKQRDGLFARVAELEAELAEVPSPFRSHGWTECKDRIRADERAKCAAELRAEAERIALTKTPARSDERVGSVVAAVVLLSAAKRMDGRDGGTVVKAKGDAAPSSGTVSRDFHLARVAQLEAEVAKQHERATQAVEYIVSQRDAAARSNAERAALIAYLQRRLAALRAEKKARLRCEHGIVTCEACGASLREDMPRVACEDCSLCLSCSADMEMET